MPPSVRREAPSPAPRPNRIEFDRFELDLRSGELRKSGRRIRLLAQPFQLLTMLLEHAGEVVTREEACRNLWKNDTFVDFDHRLAEAISKIRETLGDSAENPKYIETLPKRGYRFIGKITPGAPVVMPVPEAQQRTELQPGSTPATGENGDSIRIETVGKTRWFTRQVAWGIALAAVAIAVSASWFFSERPHPITAKDTIVLADFTNATGDPVFDGALRQGLSVELEQSPFLSIISDEQVRKTLEQMSQKPDTKLTPAVAREVCQRTSSTVVLDGTIAEIGSRYQLTLRASSCVDGKSIASDEVLAKNKDSVLDALSTASSDIRKKLGESPASVKKYDVPLEQVTTSSLEALKLFSVYARGGGLISPVPVLERVLELDPNFAAAYGQLSDAADDAGEAELASQYAQKAFDLRARVSERERLGISATYYSATLGDSELELRSWEVLQQLYPREWGAWNNSAVTRRSLGDYVRSLKEALEAVRLAPNKMNPYLNVGQAYVALGRCDDAKHVAEQALARGFDHPDVHILIYRAAFLDGDSTETARQMAQLLAKEGKPAFDPLWEKSTTEAYFGRLKNSRSFSGRALQAISGKNLNELSALIRDTEALREIEFGNVSQANQGITAAVALSSGRKAKILTALALARAGQPTRAQALVEDLDRSFPSHTLVQHYWLPTIRGSIELARHNPSGALDALNGVSYELGDTELLAGNLYPAYLRGQAYLAAHHATQAAAEFQKFLDHSGVILNSHLGAIARLGLARAYSLQGDKARTRKAYQDFLAMWKDADPDLPILKAAKAEYATLQ